MLRPTTDRTVLAYISYICSYLEVSARYQAPFKRTLGHWESSHHPITSHSSVEMTKVFKASLTCNPWLMDLRNVLVLITDYVFPLGIISERFFAELLTGDNINLVNIRFFHVTLWLQLLITHYVVGNVYLSHFSFKKNLKQRIDTHESLVDMSQFTIISSNSTFIGIMILWNEIVF